MTLFDDTPYRRPELGEQAARTVRARKLIALGLHPLSAKLKRALWLHPLAGPARCACERGKVSPRQCGTHSLIRAEPATTCGSCVFLGALDRDERDNDLPGPFKCWHGGRGERVSRGAATTIRRWWPACVDWRGWR